MMVPEFDNALFTQKIGETKIVKSSFGYHLVQVEDGGCAHPIAQRGAATIQATLFRQRAAAAEENYAQALTSEAIKNGLERPPQPIILKWPPRAARRAGRDLSAA